MIATSFGMHRIFDAHAHFFGRSFLAGLGRQAGMTGDAADAVARRLKWDLPPNDPAAIGRRWLEEMNRHGVDRMVVIHTLPGEIEEATAGIAAGPNRLAGYAMIDPAASDAVGVLQRAVVQHGFCGLALFPAMFRFSMTSEPAYALLETANRHRLNVFVHCGVLKTAFRPKLGLPSAFDGSYSNPMTLQRPAAEFPDCNFIVPHLGSGYFRELLMLADMAPNVYADTSGVNGWARYLAGSPTAAQVLRQAVDVMGADRLLFGTDSTFFPRGWRRDIFEQQNRIFEEAGLTAEQAGQILGGNLGRMIQ